MQIFIGGIGCFWNETEYQGTPGIISTECGYCGGKNQKVSYEQVCDGNTEHIDVVKVTFDPKLISYEDIAKLFFKIHDPTTLNRQGPNVGHQYRSEIFYTTEEEKISARKVLDEVSKKLKGKVVTTIRKEKNYCKAEEYHQKYFEKKSKR
ncbi:MAG TPA: peptide-methionine (S)-S-oxide reductase MsrA [Candidatus Pelagibacter sp.]|nr:peptide-methionine (S)-S-oxide reductase MsrA [Candidatus Pelagibacter sp.]